MARSYYGYVQRNAGDYVNWAAISDNLVKVLQEEGAKRIAVQSAIEEADREWGAVLASPPQGTVKSFNEWAIEAGQQGAKYRMMTTRLLKSGRMSLNDYLVSRQNAVDGTQGLFDLMREYNEEAKSRMEDWQSGKTSYLDLDIMSDIEAFSNYTRTGVYYSPVNGEVNVAFKKESTDGSGNKIYTMDDNPNSFSSVNSMRNRIRTRYEKFKMGEEVGGMVTSLGQDIQVLERVKATTTRQGVYVSINDFLQKKNLPKDAQGAIISFEKAETALLESMLSNNFKVGSVLTDYLVYGTDKSGNKVKYGYTWDENEAKADPFKMLKKLDGNGNLIIEVSDEQRKAAIERLRLEARMRYGREETSNVTGTTPQLMRQSSGGSNQRDPLDAEAQNIARQISFILVGNQADAAAATNYFSSYGITIKKDKDKITVTTKDGRRLNPFVMAGSPFSLGSSMVGALRTSNDIPENLIVSHLQRFIGSAGFNTGSQTSGVNEQYDKGSLETYLNRINSSIIKNDDETNAPKNLENLFFNLGFTFEGREAGLWGDKSTGASAYQTDIIIKAPNGKSTIVNIDNVGVGTFNKIKDFIRQNLDPAKAAVIFAPK